jgi:hypothetical protein
VGASLTLFLTDGVLLGLCSASAVSSFLPVLRLGLVNLEGYIAFPLFPHLSAISLSLEFVPQKARHSRITSFDVVHLCFDIYEHARALDGTGDNRFI